MLSVVSMGVLIMGVMFMNYKFTNTMNDVSKETHLRLDYSDKEDAFLRALVHIVPERAQKAMMDGSGAGNSPVTDISWASIFESAIQQANAESSLTGIVASIKNDSQIIGNSGDTDNSFLTSIHGLTNAGLNNGKYVFVEPSSKVDTPQPVSYSNAALSPGHDLEAPVICLSKGYFDGNSFNQYTLTPYPNIQFGYSKPGELILAKHNWWAFAVDFASVDSDNTKLGSTTKHYMISLYEIPSQLPISADAFMKMGQHDNNSNWGENNINIEGRIFASEVRQAAAGTQVDGIATRRGGEISDMSDITGIDLAQMSREDFNNKNANIYSNEENFFPISRSSDSGKVNFIPINRGIDFFKYHGNYNNNGTSFSPTAWDDYSRGARQCSLTIEIVSTYPHQGSTSVDGICITATQLGGSQRSLYYLRPTHPLVGSQAHYRAWNFNDESFPIQPRTVSATKQGAIALDLSKLPTFLAAESFAPELNNTIHVTHRASDDNNFYVSEENFKFPPDDNDVALIIEGADDMTQHYSHGFALVSNLRTFFDSNLNFTSHADGTYPAVAIFSPEQRYGAEDVDVGIELRGRVSMISSDDDKEIAPLDLKSASGEIFTSELEIDLKPMKRLDDLPPIHFINWLVVVSEI